MALLDWDGHWEQVKGETTEIVIRGETFELPPDMPMTWVVMTQMPETADDVDWDNAVLILMNSLFTEEKVREWFVNGMTVEEYGSIARMVVSHLTRNSKIEEEDGDADPKAEEGS